MSTTSTFPSTTTRNALAALLDRHMSCWALHATANPSCGMPEPELADGATWQAAHVADAILRAEYGADAPSMASTESVDDRQPSPQDDTRAWKYVAPTGEVAVPVDVLGGLADLLLEAAGAPQHTEQCVRDRWSLLHTGSGPCVCQQFTPEQIDAAAQKLDVDGLWHIRFAPGPDGVDRSERYRDALRGRVRTVLAAVISTR
jgi:hypothetical protein